MITAGVDVGTRFLKICLVEDKTLLGQACLEMGGRFDRLYKQAMAAALQQASENSGRRIMKRSVRKIIATGYGGHLATKAAFKLNEPACIARGAYTLNPAVRCVIDAGGLFIRVVTMDEYGFPADSSINEKCAAGSGKFLEMVSASLGVKFNAISPHCRQATNPFQISNSCAVFAESEVISQVNAGISSADILAGVVKSIAAKTRTLLEGLDPQEEIAICGGLARVEAFVAAIEASTGRTIKTLPQDPQLTAAFGAAVIAGGDLLRRKERGHGD